MNERDQAIAAAFQATLAALFADWDVVPLRDGEEIVGAVFMKGAELHVGVSRVPRASHRRLVREILCRTIERHGAATTQVRSMNVRGIAFCKRLGFEVVEESDGIVHLKCKRARHA